MPRPKVIDESGLFTYDHRHDGSRFWFLEPPIRPIVHVGQEGRFIRPGMMEDESAAEAGNVALAAFPDAFVAGQVWVIDHVGVFNGGVAAKAMGVQLVYNGIAHNLRSVDVGVGAPMEMLLQPFYIDEQIGLQVVLGGAAPDQFTVHARRVA